MKRIRKVIGRILVMLGVWIYGSGEGWSDYYRVDVHFTTSDRSIPWIGVGGAINATGVDPDRIAKALRKWYSL